MTGVLELKINFTLWDLLLSGGTRVIFELANRLQDRGHEVTITSLKKRDVSWFPLKAEVRCVERSIFPRTIDYGFRRMGLDVKIDFIELLAKSIPDCDVNVGTFYPTAFAVYRSEKGIPFYYAQHYEPLITTDPYERSLAGEIYYLPLNVVTVSTWIKDAIYRDFAKETTVVLNGVNLDVFHPREVKRDSEDKIVLCRPSNIWWKGFYDLIEAMKIVYKARSDVQLAMFTAERLLFRKFPFPVKMLSSPSDKDVAKLYSSCDVFVSSSWYEGFHMPPLEAMACGAPVVTTDCGGGVSDYAKDRFNALVVPSRNPNALANAILKVLSDESLAKTLGKNGTTTAKQFTWDKTVSEIEELFRKALKSTLVLTDRTLGVPI